MNKNIKSPQLYTPPRNQPSIFLAGSIEMGQAENWQDDLVHQFHEFNVAFYNPRRDDWDSSWQQTSTDVQFNEQVTWELIHIDKSDLCVFYFDHKTVSPITLMELGYAGGVGKSSVVYCPKAYFREGNVKIFCDRYTIPVFSDKEKFMEYLQSWLNQYMEWDT